MTIDTVLNTLVLMGAVPEPGTPPHETHIVRSTAVLRDVQYHNHNHTHKDGGGELLSYESYDPVSSEKISVQDDAFSGGGVTVTLDGVELLRFSSMGLALAHGEAAWTLDERTRVVEVSRVAGGRVAIVLQK